MMNKVGVQIQCKNLGITLVLTKKDILRWCRKPYEKKYNIAESTLNVSKTGRVSVTLRMKVNEENRREEQRILDLKKAIL